MTNERIDQHIGGHVNVFPNLLDQPRRGMEPDEAEVGRRGPPK